jgi:hypothetical protein
MLAIESGLSSAAVISYKIIVKTYAYDILTPKSGGYFVGNLL